VASLKSFHPVSLIKAILAGYYWYKVLDKQSSKDFLGMLSIVERLEEIELPYRTYKHRIKVKLMKGYALYSSANDVESVAALTTALEDLRRPNNGYNNDEVAYLSRYASDIGKWASEQANLDSAPFDIDWVYDISNVDGRLLSTFPNGAKNA
jgi:hypothetical protein